MIVTICGLAIGAPARGAPNALLAHPQPAQGAARWAPPPWRLGLDDPKGAASTREAAPTVAPATPARKGSLVRSIVFGSALGIAGFWAGGSLGSKLSDECDGSTELCLESGTVLGAAGGGTLGLALGVHLGNDAQGSLAKDLLVASAIWAAGVALALSASDVAPDASIGILVAIPIAQLGFTVKTERAAGRRRAAGQP